MPSGGLHLKLRVDYFGPQNTVFILLDKSTSKRMEVIDSCFPPLHASGCVGDEMHCLCCHLFLACGDAIAIISIGSSLDTYLNVLFRPIQDLFYRYLRIYC